MSALHYAKLAAKPTGIPSEIYQNSTRIFEFFQPMKSQHLIYTGLLSCDCLKEVHLKKRKWSWLYILRQHVFEKIGV